MIKTGACNEVKPPPGGAVRQVSDQVPVWAQTWAPGPVQITAGWPLVCGGPTSQDSFSMKPHPRARLGSKSSTFDSCAVLSRVQTAAGSRPPSSRRGRLDLQQAAGRTSLVPEDQLPTGCV